MSEHGGGGGGGGGSVVLQELVTLFGFEVDDHSIHKLNESIETIKHGITALAVSIAGSAFGIFEIVHATGEAGEQLNLMSKRLGIGVESLQGLQYAAHLANVSSEDLGRSVGFLNRALYNAKTEGGQSLRAFNSLGISLNQVKGLNADTAFDLIADKIAAIKDPAKVAAISMEIFGRGGQRLIPVLAKGAAHLRELKEEAAAFGQFTSEQANEAEEYEDSMKRLSAVFAGLRRAVGIGFLEQFKEAADSLRHFVMQNREIIKTNLSGFVAALNKYLKVMFAVFLNLAEATARVVARFGGMEQVMTVLLGLFGVLTSVGILAAFGKMAEAIWGVVGAFLAGDAAIGFWPLIIGVCIAAVGLLAEDLFTYFNGGDSIFGRVSTWFSDTFPNAAKVMGTFVEFVKEIWIGFYEAIQLGWDLVKLSFDAIIGMFVDAYDWFAKLLGIATPFGEIMGGIADKIKGAIGTAGSMRDSTFKFLHEGIQSYDAHMNDQTNATLNTAGYGTAMGDISTKIEVNVPPGTNPNEVGGHVERGVQLGLEGVLRQAKRTTSLGVVY